MHVETMLGSTSIDEFVSQLNECRPFLVRSDPAVLRRGLFSWDDLRHLLTRHRLEWPTLRLYAAGETVSEDRYLAPADGRTQPRIRSGELFRLLEAGATMVLDGIDARVDTVADAAQSIERALSARSTTNCYASWEGVSGFGLHWDEHHALVAQLEGSKAWRLIPPTRSWPLSRDVERPSNPPAGSGYTVTTTPGELLLIPQGWWHSASPTTSPSLHLTFAIALDNGFDFLSDVADQLLDNERVRCPAPTSLSDGHDFTTELRHLVDRGLADPQALAEFRRHRNATAPTRAVISLPKTTPVSAMAVRLIAGRASHLRIGNDTEYLEGNATRVQFSAAALPAVELLLERTTVSFAELARAAAGEVPVDELEEMVLELVRVGLLAVVPIQAEGLSRRD